MKKFYMCLFSVLFIAGCANQLSPGGGDRDTTPPEIEEVYPPNGTLNFDDDYISITFNEYVEQRSSKEAVFISPKIFGDLEYDWSGKTLDIEIPDTSLKKNITYVVTIGTDVVDINEKNRMAEPFVFVFSTGSKIDSGVVQGKVYDDDPSGTMVYLYRLDSVDVNPAADTPDYITQIGEKGDYRIMGIREGKYRAFAVKDEYRDLKYNVETDGIGCSFGDFFVSERDSAISGINFKLTREDTTKPEIANVTMTDMHHIFVDFNEAVDSTKLSTDSFMVIDSTSGRSIPVNYFFKGKSKNLQFLITVDDSINAENDYLLETGEVVDKKGNINYPAPVRFVASDRPDTTKPKIIGITALKDNKINYADPEFSLIFDDAVEYEKFKQNISLKGKADKELKYDTEKIDDGNFTIHILETLLPDSEIQLTVLMKNLIDIAGNPGDSTYKAKIRTNNDLDFTGASGKVIPHIKDDVYVILSQVDESEEYEMKTDSLGSFNFEKVLPGKYLLWCFADSDSSSDYSFGKTYPFKSAEKFVYYPDTLNLRARWPVGDITLNISK